jgi:hypothetical protein
VVSQYPGLDVHANAVDDLVDIYIHGALRAPKGE